MDYLRVGDKVISISKINRSINEILELRGKGYSQQEVSRTLNIDRTFISRLESLGEVRKGGDIAVIGFPVENKEELYRELKQAGVDYILLMTEDERNNYIKSQGGRDLFNGMLELISEVRKYQHCIIIGSNMRVKLISSLLNNDIYLLDIGESPLQESVHVDVEKVLEIVRNIKS